MVEYETELREMDVQVALQAETKSCNAIRFPRDTEALAASTQIMLMPFEYRSVEENLMWLCFFYTTAIYLCSDIK